MIRDYVAMLDRAFVAVHARIDDAATSANLARKLHVGRINRSFGQRFRRIAETGESYAVFVRRDRVTFLPDVGISAARLRGNPESAACEVGVFGPAHPASAIAEALGRVA